MRFVDLEANIMRYFCEHISNLPDESIHMLGAVDMTYAPDRNFVIATD